MHDLLRILAVFALVVVLLKRRWNLGLVMLAGGAAMGLLTGMGAVRLLVVSFRSATSVGSLTLIAALALIMILENVMKKTGAMKTLVDSLRGIFGDNRVVMGMMPAIIGILPSPGGALFSAPLVEESASGSCTQSDRMGFINHWFRHVWEYVSPLFPGFILAAAVAEVGYGRLFSYQVIFPVTVLAVGTAFGFRGVPRAPREEGGPGGIALAGRLAASFSPILAAMLLVLVFDMNIAVSMFAVVAGTMAWFRYGPGRVLETLRESLSVKTLLLVAGIMVFKGVMKESGVVDSLPGFFAETGVPVEAVLFILPFMVGMMTGITLAFVGVTFPMLLPLIGGAGSPDMGMLAFAYASGFAGVMFSPVHLCLVLTKDYFHCDLVPIYRRMALPQALVVAVAFAQMLLR